jgi:hypothetical protein
MPTLLNSPASLPFQFFDPTGSAAVSDDPEEAFAAIEPIAGIVFAFIMVVTWISLAVAVKAGFGKRRPSPPKDPL